VARELEEHKYINEEIIVHQRLIIQLFTFSIIASVALLGYGVQNFSGEQGSISELSPFVIFAPMAIIVPCAWVITKIRKEIFRWGAYIMVFHESEKPGYETMLDKIRDIRNSWWEESYTPLVITWWGLCAACTGLFIWGVLHTPLHWCWSMLSILPLGFLGRTTDKFCKIPTKGYRQKLEKEWSEAKQATESSK